MRSKSLRLLWLAALLALFTRGFLLEVYSLPGGSMLPTLWNNDVVFVNKLAYGVRLPFTDRWLLHWSEPKRGDLSLVRVPQDHGSYHIKRIVGEPGDKIALQNGNLLINDQVIERKVPSSNVEFEGIADSDLQKDGNPYDGKANYIHFREVFERAEHGILIRRGDVYDSFGPVTVLPGQVFVLGDNRTNSVDSRAWGMIPNDDIIGRVGRVWFSCSEVLPLLGGICQPLTIRWERTFKGVQ